MLNLQIIRKSRSMSQQKLADSICVSRSTVAMWETEASQPDNDTLIKLSKCLNVSIDMLLNNTDTIIEPLNPFPVTPEERLLLEKFRKLDPAKRQAIENMLDLL